MKRVLKIGKGEIVEKKSRFISIALNVDSPQQALDYVNSIKKKYYDARHNCYAYICGNDGQEKRFSDDGEPSGTAGKPMLDVLEGFGVTNCLVVVTRYFGGTLLGTGGLVKAYCDSAKAVLDKGIYVPLIERRPFSFSLEYDLYNQVKRFLSDYDITEEKEDFGTDIHLSGLVPQDNFDAIQKYIISLTKGKVSTIEL